MNAITKLEKALEAKTLDALVAAASQEDAFLVMDCSGSMAGSPLANLKKVVDDIRTQAEPQMVAFAGGYWEGGNCFMVGDVPADAGGGTPLGEAINFAKANGATRIVLISDGCPDDREAAMNAAMLFLGRIDVVFIGAAGSAGEAFLDKLARATGGSRFTGDIGETKKLSAVVAGFLSA
jgi:uncharacterized protein YegL